MDIATFAQEMHLYQGLGKPQRSKRPIDDDPRVEPISVFIRDDESLLLLRRTTIVKGISAKLKAFSGDSAQVFQSPPNVPLPQKLPGTFNGFLRSRPDSGTTAVPSRLRITVIRQLLPGPLRFCGRSWIGSFALHASSCGNQGSKLPGWKSVSREMEAEGLVAMHSIDRRSKN